MSSFCLFNSWTSQKPRPNWYENYGFWGCHRCWWILWVSQSLWKCISVTPLSFLWIKTEYVTRLRKNVSCASRQGRWCCWKEWSGSSLYPLLSPSITAHCLPSTDSASFAELTQVCLGRKLFFFLYATASLSVQKGTKTGQHKRRGESGSGDMQRGRWMAETVLQCWATNQLRNLLWPCPSWSHMECAHW